MIAGVRAAHVRIGARPGVDRAAVDQPAVDPRVADRPGAARPAVVLPIGHRIGLLRDVATVLAATGRVVTAPTAAGRTLAVRVVAVKAVAVQAAGRMAAARTVGVPTVAAIVARIVAPRADATSAGAAPMIAGRADETTDPVTPAVAATIAVRTVRTDPSGALIAGGTIGPVLGAGMTKVREPVAADVRPAGRRHPGPARPVRAGRPTTAGLVAPVPTAVARKDRPSTAVDRRAGDPTSRTPAVIAAADRVMIISSASAGCHPASSRRPVNRRFLLARTSGNSTGAYGPSCAACPRSWRRSSPAICSSPAGWSTRVPSSPTPMPRRRAVARPGCRSFARVPRRRRTRRASTTSR